MQAGRHHDGAGGEGASAAVALDPGADARGDEAGDEEGPGVADQ